MINSIKKFKSFIGDKTWKIFWYGTAIGLLWFLVEASFVFVLQLFLRAIGLLSESQVFLPEWLPKSLGFAIVVLIIFGIFRSLNFMLKNYYATGAQVSFTCHQRAKLLEYGIREAGQTSPKELISVFSEMVTQSGIVVFYISQLINTIIAMSLLFVLGVNLAPVEMIIGVFLLFIFLLPFRLLTKKIKFQGEGIVKEWENINEALLRGLKNNFLLKIYNQFDSEIQKGNTNLENYEKHYMNYSIVAGINSSFSLFIGVIVLSVIAFFSIRYVGTAPIKLVSFFYIFIRLAQSASEANTTISSVKFNWPGFKILYHWSMLADNATKNKITKKDVKISLDSINIQLEDVSFTYSSGRKILSHINLSIGKSEILVIRGESGAGKSTLLSLILGVNNPSAGRVLINGYDVSINELNLYQAVAYVGPEPYLVEGTIRENLMYGLDKSITVSDEIIYSALVKMELRTLIDSLPLGLGEFIYNVPQFSTGQKQRLSFARALIRQPRLLILDEATANLDSDTELKIILNLKDYFTGCTSVIVTHKNSFDIIATKHITLQK